MARLNFEPKEDVAHGRGWVGTWFGGALGWAMPKHLEKHYTHYPVRGFVTDEDRLYLCEITVKLVRDKNGRPIIRRGGQK